MLLDGHRLVVADFHGLSIVNLSDDAEQATAVTPIRDPAFNGTFSVARVADRYLAVNSATGRTAAVHLRERARALIFAARPLAPGADCLRGAQQLPATTPSGLIGRATCVRHARNRLSPEPGHDRRSGATDPRQLDQSVRGGSLKPLAGPRGRFWNPTATATTTPLNGACQEACVS